MMKFLFYLFCFSYCPFAWADFLVVTHASSVFDELRSAKIGIQSAISFFQEKNLKIFHIHTQDAETHSGRIHYYAWPENVASEKIIIGEGGEHDLTPKAGERVVLVGGYFHGCLTGTITSFIENFYQKYPLNQSLKLEVYMPGAYSFRYWKELNTVSHTVADVIQSLDAQELIQTFENESYGVQDYGEALQGAQHSAEDHLARKKNHTFVLKVKGKEVGRFGGSARPLIEVNLIDKL